MKNKFETTNFEPVFTLVIILKIKWGVDIEDSIREAINISTTLNMPVMFDFNQVLVKINPNDDPIDVIRKWYNDKRDRSKLSLNKSA